MKKITIVLVIVLFKGYYAISQKDIPQNSIEISGFNEFKTNGTLSWGLQLGVNYANLYGKDRDFIFQNETTEFHSGWSGGLFVHSSISHHFGLKHQVIFAHKRVGVQLSDSNNEFYSSLFRSASVDLMPFAPGLQLNGFQCYVGPYVSSLLWATMERKDENGVLFRDKSIFGTPDNDETEQRNLQKFDFGWIAALEYQFRFGLLLNVQYARGLTDIFQYANSYANGDTKTSKINVYRCQWTFSIGMKF